MKKFIKIFLGGLSASIIISIILALAALPALIAGSIMYLLFWCWL